MTMVPLNMHCQCKAQQTLDADSMSNLRASIKVVQF